VSYATSAFRRDVGGSDKQYAFHHTGTSGKLYVFEAPIDMLSYISLHKQNWQADSYIALGGVSPAALNHFLKMQSGIREVCLCLDNDRAGHEAVQRIGRDLQKQGYEISAYLPHYKDWNQQLQETKQAQALTQTTEPGQTNAPALVMKGIDVT